MPNYSSKKLKSMSPILVLLSVGFVALLIHFLRGKRVKPENNPILIFGKYRKLRKYIEAQARLESGNYTNSLAVKYYNIFSMTFPTKRNATNEGSVFLHIDNQSVYWSKYSSYTQAIKDLILWLEYNKIQLGYISSVDDYNDFLYIKGFYTSSKNEYLKGLKKYL